MTREPFRRCSTGNFVKKFGGTLSAELDNPLLVREVQEAAPRIAEFYEQREFGKAMREIMALADHTNGYIAEKAPWSLAKEEGKEQEVLAIPVYLPDLNSPAGQSLPG